MDTRKFYPRFANCFFHSYTFLFFQSTSYKGCVANHSIRWSMDHSKKSNVSYLKCTVCMSECTCACALLYSAQSMSTKGKWIHVSILGMSCYPVVTADQYRDFLCRSFRVPSTHGWTCFTMWTVGLVSASLTCILHITIIIKCRLRIYGNNLILYFYPNQIIIFLEKKKIK